MYIVHIYMYVKCSQYMLHLYHNVYIALLFIDAYMCVLVCD